MKYLLRPLEIASRTVFVALALLSASIAVWAESITKTYEFGLGTQYAHSAMRTFSVPCGRAVTAVVKFQRSGPDSADSDIPAKIDLHEPDASGTEGPIARTESVFISRTVQSKTLTGSAKDRGCSLPWRVRIRYANSGTAPYAVTGNITLTFSTNSSNILVNDGRDFHVSHHRPVTVNFGGPSGLHQGRLEVNASWIHFIYTIVPGPLTIMLTFQLLDPAGNPVAQASGCATNNFDSSCRLMLRYFVPEHKSGQWKLKISSSPVAYGEAGDIKPTAVYRPDCP